LFNSVIYNNNNKNKKHSTVIIDAHEHIKIIGGQLLAASTTLNTEYYTPSFDERMYAQQATSIRHNYMRATAAREVKTGGGHLNEPPKNLQQTKLSEITSQ
jgi:hypothetical protein